MGSSRAPTPELSYTPLPMWWTNNEWAAVIWSEFYPVTTTSDPEPIYDGYAYTITAEDLPTLTAEGYTFKGWTLADGTPVNVGDTITADTELVAVWEENAPAHDPASMLLGWLTGERIKAWRGATVEPEDPDAPYTYNPSSKTLTIRDDSGLDFNWDWDTMQMDVEEK